MQTPYESLGTSGAGGVRHRRLVCLRGHFCGEEAGAGVFPIARVRPKVVHMRALALEHARRACSTNLFLAIMSRGIMAAAAPDGAKVAICSDPKPWPGTLAKRPNLGPRQPRLLRQFMPDAAEVVVMFCRTRARIQ